MTALYWISGTVTASQKTHNFMALVTADNEALALGKCTRALEKDWVVLEIDQIRTIDPADSYKVEPLLQDAIAYAREDGVSLFIGEQPISN
jgi:hypothetical protein